MLFQFQLHDKDIVLGRYSETRHGDELCPYKKRRRYVEMQSFQINNEVVLKEETTSKISSSTRSQKRSSTSVSDDPIVQSERERTHSQSENSESQSEEQVISISFFAQNDDSSEDSSHESVTTESSSSESSEHLSDYSEVNSIFASLLTERNRVLRRRREENRTERRLIREERRRHKDMIKKFPFKHLQKYYLTVHDLDKDYRNICFAEESMIDKSKHLHLFNLKYLTTESEQENKFLYRLHCYKDEEYVIEVDVDGWMAALGKISEGTEQDCNQIFQINRLNHSIEWYKNRDKEIIKSREAGATTIPTDTPNPSSTNNADTDCGNLSETDTIFSLEGSEGYIDEGNPYLEDEMSDSDETESE